MGTNIPDNGGGGEQNDYNSPQGSLYYPTNCNGQVIITVEQIPYKCSSSDEHWPWETCNCGKTADSDCTPPGYHQIPYYYCNEDSNYNNGDNTTNDNNQNGGGNSEGLGGSNEENPSITAVLGPDDECLMPPAVAVFDLNNNCELSSAEVCLMRGFSDEICDCVAEGNELSKCQADIKCERLNRLVKNDSIGSNILPIVNQLRTKLSAGNKEWSISYKNKWIDGNRKNVPDDSGVQEGVSATRSEASYGNTWVGFIHTHPDGKFNIFSWLDLRVLMLLHTDSHENFNDEIFIMAVAPSNKTYALRVDNIQTLIDEVDDDMQNAKGNNDNEKRENLMLEMAEKYTKSSNLEQKFLDLYGSYGISLYEATDANLSNWKKLELDKDDNQKVNKTPCN